MSDNWTGGGDGGHLAPFLVDRRRFLCDILFQIPNFTHHLVLLSFDDSGLDRLNIISTGREYVTDTKKWRREVYGMRCWSKGVEVCGE